ncbi:2-aminoethylphosphonate--pyruvate transaminase [Pseudoalteromonas sp. MMG013]|uniref:2-aminoethylphosphonate--pyruvate transaminase n=1 Tax=Pseudoalteromonas sp. MMG013 TaxID=2822687 RepID=UPI001B37FB3C|nr:2-aminoethylphosphonate--pyruvate transaminase [Pseudoalteromonas sp. MMG013]MBQ4863745.1 2-aminoethylphosphonate--pyruvate transaminase [Pseudoalteromonas sp. MMG013]
MDKNYLLLTPGPLTTSATVKQAMLKDWCTWDEEYNVGIVQKIRSELCQLASTSDQFTATLMQGSGTASVEAALGTFINKNATVLVINNGAYGARIKQIAEYLTINLIALDYSETHYPDISQIKNTLENHPHITHIVMVHCETTTGMLNPLEEVAALAKEFNKVMILDAMSSFGGIPIDMQKLHIDVLISSSNKCIQGVPGFGFVISKKSLIAQCKGNARSLSLDLFDQWETMEKHNGKWRFTSPTHVVRAFDQALTELHDEGGVAARHKRYAANQSLLVSGMKELGFTPLLPEQLHSPIITTFLSPEVEHYDFKRFYLTLKSLGYVIYPGKVSDSDCFRIGNIGEVYQSDIEGLLQAISEAKDW